MESAERKEERGLSFCGFEAHEWRAKEWYSVNDGLAGRWRCSLSGAFVVTVVEDFSNGCRFGDEGDNLHLGSAPTG